MLQHANSLKLGITKKLYTYREQKVRIVMSLRIEDDELRRKRQDDYGMNVGQVQMPQPNGFPNGGGEMSFADKYGTDNIFGVSPDQVQTPTFQTSGSQAGSSAGSSLLPPDNNSGGTFSLSDAVQMDNLPVAATATPVQTPELASGLTATGDTERDGAQGGATDNGSNKGGHPSFGAGDVMNITDGGLTSSNPRFSLSPELPGFGSPTSTGDATLNPTPTDTSASGISGTGGANGADGTDGAGAPDGTGNPDNVDDPANNGGIENPDDNNGAGETGQDGTGKTPEQLAQEEAEKQAQIQQQKLLEQQRQEEQLKQQQGG